MREIEELLGKVSTSMINNESLNELKKSSVFSNNDR